MTDVDREAIYDDGPPELGAPVDPPDRAPVFADLVSRADNRRPIVPAALRSRDQRRVLYRWAVRFGAHTTAYHVTRLPKYGMKVAWWAPVGAGRLVHRTAHWLFDLENRPFRQEALRKRDTDRYVTLVKQRDRRVSRRLLAAGVITVPALVAVVLLVVLAPLWLQYLTVATGVLVVARVGRPADRPITDRVLTGPRFLKLTAEMVRTAVMSMGLAGLKEPGQLKFPQEIHRDGPGYLAVVDLPPGLDAVKVVEDKRLLASGLRLPADQVWPETMPKAHPGRVAIWVGDQPASQTTQPAWSLLHPAARVDVFKDFDLCTDPRQRPIKVGLLFRNWLIGGQPGSGKTVSARDIALACALDPRVELRLFELKGTGDLDPLEPLCTDFASGADDETAEAAARAVTWAYAECGKRGKLIKHYAKIGKAPANKVTPELAAAGVGLHPVLLVIDEAQELFTHPEYGAAAGVTLEKVIKLGRALGIIVVISTQIPDKKSLPPNITRCVNSRLCHSVADYLANDMILGTSMYKNGFRATDFKPVDDAGWGILAGFGKTGPVRSYNPSDKGIAKIVARALDLRGGPAESAPRERVPAYNLLDDIETVWPDGEERVWSEVLIKLLAEMRPEVYGDWVGADGEGNPTYNTTALAAALKGYKISTGQVWGTDDQGRGANRRGIARADLLAAIDSRRQAQLARSGGPSEALEMGALEH